MRRPRGRAVRHEPLWHKLWLLLRMAEPDAYTRVVCRTNAVDNCLRKRWWRVLLVKCFMRGHRRTRLPHRHVPQRYVNAEYLRLLHEDSDSRTHEPRAHITADVTTHNIADTTALATPVAQPYYYMGAHAQPVVRPNFLVHTGAVQAHAHPDRHDRRRLGGCHREH